MAVTAAAWSGVSRAGSSEPVRARICSVRAASTTAIAWSDPRRRDVDRLPDRRPALPISGHHPDLQGQQLVESKPAQGGVAEIEVVRVVGVLEGGRRCGIGSGRDPGCGCRTGRGAPGQVLRVAGADRVECLADGPPQRRRPSDPAVSR